MRIALNLMALCLVLGVALGVVNGVTKPIIEEQERIAKERAMQSLIPKAASFARVDGPDDVYQALDEERRVIGYVINAEATGYSSIIKMSYGVKVSRGEKKKFFLTGLQVISQTETPGLGTKIADPWFFMQFKGKQLDNLTVKRYVERSPRHITAITGATISSEAVTRGVSGSLEKFLRSVAEEQ